LSLQDIISNFYKAGELVFFPSFCRLCSGLLELPGEKLICTSCWDQLKVPSSSFCLCCGRFFEGAGEPHLCSSCFQKSPPFSVHRSCGRYGGVLKDIILLYKYRRFKVLGKGLARFAFDALGKDEDFWRNVEVIIPVPLHRKRKKQRGFNQAQVIARELAKLRGIRLEEALVKTKNVPPQTLIDWEEREKNVSGAFQVADKEKIKGRCVLLLDDVFTTGATIRECSCALIKAGVREVRAMTLAQA